MSAGSHSPIARNAILRAAAEIVAKAASLVFFVTMARELGRDGFGAFMFALGLTGALLAVAGFGTDELTAREVARDRPRAGRYLSDVTALKLCSAVLLLGVAVGIASVGDFSAAARGAVVIVGLGVAIETVAATWYMIFQAHERLDLVSLSVVLQRTTTAVVGVAVLKLGGGVIAASIVFTGGALIGLAVSEVSVRRLIARRPRPQPRTWPRLLKRSFPIGVAFVLFILLLRLDVTLLSFIAGEAEVGVYAAAFRLIESTQFLPWALSAAMMPWLARATGNDADGKLARGYELGLKAMNGILLPISLVFVLFAEGLIDLLYGEAYEAAVVPLRLLGLTGALYGMQSFASTTLVARDSPGSFARLVGLVVVLNIAGNVIAIPRYGADGAAAVALVSGAILGVASLWLAGRRIGGVRYWRAFAGPLIASVAMTLVALAVPGPLIPAVALALAVYVVALLAVERLAFRDDLEMFLNALPRRLSSLLPSRSRAGR